LNFRQTFDRHLPTAIFTVLSLVFGFQIWLIGLLADLIASSRRITEETLYRIKRIELEMAQERKPTDEIAPKDGNVHRRDAESAQAVKARE
jgi:hypothetical protein